MTDRQDIVLLLAEDDSDDVHFFRLALERRGHLLRPEVVPNGEEALDYVTGRGPYVNRDRFPLPTHVLLDMKLPKKSGVEVLQWMKSRRDLAQIPVAIISSSAQSADQNRTRDLGAERYWIKPVSFQALLALVDEIARWAA